MLLLIIILSIIGLAATIWLIVVGFKEHILWGLGIIFVPLVPIIFAIMHWQKAKKPFLISIACSIIITVMMFNTMMSIFVSDEMMALQESAVNGEASEEQQRQVAVKLFEELGLPVPEQLQTPAPTETELSTEEEIARLTEKLNRGGNTAPSPTTEQAEPEPQKIVVFNTIKLNQTPQFIGERLRVVSKTGIEREGKLISVNPLSIVLEQSLNGGKFSFEVFNRDIKNIKVRQVELL